MYTHLGSDAAPEYSLRHPDPTSQSSRNRYAAALYDSYNPEILYAEVLLTPEWSQHKASSEEIRLNGGVPPAPHPILPTEFIIQLYNPDQQIPVKYHAGTWTSAAYWEFEMPQQSFRQPSVSAIDRTQDDPTASDNTPKLEFKWKKDGKLSKDYVCLLSEKATNPDGSKRKNKEPDITLGIFRNLKEITVYEPNLSRVEIEDPKGFEVVLLLGAVVIREVFNCNLNEAFNISDQSSSSNPISPILAPLKTNRFQSTSPPAQILNAAPPSASRPPPTDPRTQWELDNEAAALKKQVEREQAEQRRADAAETKRVKRMLEDEQRQERERQKEIDRETERLKKIYGKEERKSLQQLQKQQQQQQQQHPPPLPARHSVHGLASLSQQPYQPQQPQPQYQQQASPSFPPPPPQRHVRQRALHSTQSAPARLFPKLGPESSPAFQLRSASVPDDGRAGTGAGRVWERV